MRDFAFYINDNIEVQEILKVIRGLKINILKEINVFDVYMDHKKSEKKKSVAFSILLQPKDRTLFDYQINNISDKIIDVISQKLGGKLRYSKNL